MVLGRELEALGCGPIERDNAQVAFPYSPENLARSNTWLRTADRVWLQLCEFPCADFEELFQGMKAIPWPEMLPREASFPVEVITTKSQLSSVSSCQSVAKKAVVECMHSAYGRSRLAETGAEFAIRVFLVRDRARVFLDTSGEGLHRRGYKTYNAEAPLRETVAAALVLLSHWNADRELYDPMCGSGTILLEAAYIGLNRAPGLERSFASQRWDWLGRGCWEEAYREAQDAILRQQHLKLFGSDVDGRVLKLAQRHLAQAGLEGKGINFQKRDIAEFSTKRKYGVLITNPPYGRRLGSQEEVVALTQTMARVLEPLHETWSIYILSAFPDFAEVYGRPSERQRKMHNGRIPCLYYQFPGPKPPVYRSEESADGGSQRVIKRIRLSP